MKPGLVALGAMLVALPVSLQAADPAKKACMADAKRLCPDAIKAMSRSRARACLIVKVEQTSPTCHSFMLKAEADAAAGRSTAAL